MYARIAELPLEIAEYRLERLEAPVTRDLLRVTTLVRRCARPHAESRDLPRLTRSRRSALGRRAETALGALPGAALQARSLERMDGRARSRARCDRHGRHSRLQGVLLGS